MRYAVPPGIRNRGRQSMQSAWMTMGAVGRLRRRRGMMMGQLVAEKFVPELDLPGGFSPPPEEDDTIDLLLTTDDDFVAPGAVPVREENWDLEACTYRIASGDTFVGLAATYLGDGGRWREIYNTGANRQKFPSPDNIDHPGPLDMPAEACDRMIAFLKQGKPPGQLPGKIPPGEVAKLTESKTKYYVAGAVGVAALVGLGIAIWG